ncbi:MAG: fibronectin type III domain-containing protein [Rhodothermales bacterium]
MYPAIKRMSSRLFLPLVALFFAAGCGAVGAGDLPETPSLVAPRNGSPNEAVVLELQWNASTDAELYHLQVSADAQFGSLVVDDEGVNNVQYIVRDLDLGSTYFWRIRAVNGSGYSDWSETRQFKAAETPHTPAIPRLVSPQTGVEDMPTDIYFEWEPTEGASTYHIQVSLEQNFVRRSADLEGVRGERVLIRELVPTYIYWWRVRSVNPVGASEWSEVRVLEIHDLAEDV